MALLKGNVRQIYFRYLGAAFGSALISSIYGLVDSAMVGQYQGPEGTAALAIVAPVWNIIYSLGLLTGIGGSVLLSAARGAGRQKEGDEYFTAALAGTVFFAAVSWLAIAFFDAPLLRLFGARDALLPLAQQYLLPVKFVVPLFLFNQMLAAFLRNDGAPGLATAAVLAASVVSGLTGLELDGWMGLGVALFILWSGVGILKETVDPLLGEAPSEELTDYIGKKVMSYDGVLGTHDLMVHDYGPGRRFASVHVEMAAENDVMQSHDIIDNIERDFQENDHISLIIHYDPILTGDDAVGTAREWVKELVRSISPELSIHDFRMVQGPSHTNLIFDTVFIWLACVAPASCLVHFTGLGILWIYGFCQATEILKTFLGILLIKKGRWIQNVVDHA